MTRSLAAPGPLRTALACVFMALLAGCYVPVRFDAEIEIDRGGYYSMIFDGYLARARVFQGIKDGSLQGEERDRRIAQVLSDLERDPAASGVAHVRDGIFKLHWERSGDLLKARHVAFLRRNEIMLSVGYVRKTGRISVAGTPVSETQADQLTDLGLTIQGEVRVITDAEVLSHNAASERAWPAKGPGYTMYVFPVPGPRAPKPQMMIRIHDPIEG